MGSKRVKAAHPIDFQIEYKKQGIAQNQKELRFLQRNRVALKRLFKGDITYSFIMIFSSQIPTIHANVPNKHTWDDLEDTVADFAITHDIPFTRYVTGYGCETQPKAYFESHREIVLPRTGDKIFIHIDCGRFLPPECHVNITRRRTWRDQVSYSYYCIH